jgi:hypothetical protein
METRSQQENSNAPGVKDWDNILCGMCFFRAKKPDAKYCRLGKPLNAKYHCHKFKSSRLNQ